MLTDTQFYFQRLLDKAKTVGELRAMLERYDDETPVFFSYNYGDYQRTDVAEPVSRAEECAVEYSAYHRAMKVFRDDDAEFDEEIPGERVTVLVLHANRSR